MDPMTPTVNLARFRTYTYWTLVGMTVLLVAVLVVASPVPSPPNRLGLLEVVTAAVLLLAVARLSERHVPRRSADAPLAARPWHQWIAVGGGASAILSGLWIADGEPWLWAFPPATVVALVVAGLPPRRRRRGSALTVAAALGIGIILGIVEGDQPVEGFALGGAAITAFWLFTIQSTVWTWRIVVQLDEARHAAASLAVTNERLRFAADLHDIQGHTLQVIALKSELAGRLVERAPADAATEMTQVRALATEALQDTRSVVEGYRRTNLDVETTNAIALLASAGIDARLDLAPDLDTTGLTGPMRHVLGLVVREGMTNVLRHSSAKQADLTLRPNDAGDRMVLRLRNDGIDADEPLVPGGLRQLADRVSDAGGRLTWEREDGWFELRAAVPLTARAPSLSMRGGS